VNALLVPDKGSPAKIRPHVILAVEWDRRDVIKLPSTVRRYVVGEEFCKTFRDMLSFWYGCKLDLWA